MNKTLVAVIGDADSVLAFKAIGLDVYTIKGYFEVKNLLDEISSKYSVIFITEEIAIDCTDVLKKYYKKCYPAIIPIPSNSGTNGYGMECVKKNIEKAIGVDLIF